jgi:hypothetical protein
MPRREDSREASKPPRQDITTEGALYQPEVSSAARVKLPGSSKEARGDSTAPVVDKTS